MPNIWDNTDEEEKKRRMMMGAPLEGIQYRQQDTQQQAPVREQAGPPSVARTATNIAMTRALNQGLNQAEKGIVNGTKAGYNYLTEGAKPPEAPLSQYVAQDTENGSNAATPAYDKLMAEQSAAAPLSAPTAEVSNAAGPDVFSGLAGTENVATNTASDAVSQAAEQVATNAVTDGATQAVAEKGAEAVAEGAASSVGGPLSAALTLAKTGDAGRATGAGAGTYIGGILGSAFGPIGTFVGSAIGSYVGAEAGDYLT